MFLDRVLSDLAYLGDVVVLDVFCRLDSSAGMFGMLFTLEV